MSTFWFVAMIVGCTIVYLVIGFLFTLWATWAWEEGIRPAYNKFRRGTVHWGAYPMYPLSATCRTKKFVSPVRVFDTGAGPLVLVYAICVGLFWPLKLATSLLTGIIGVPIALVVLAVRARRRGKGSLGNDELSYLTSGLEAMDLGDLRTFISRIDAEIESKEKSFQRIAKAHADEVAQYRKAREVAVAQVKELNDTSQEILRQTTAVELESEADEVLDIPVVS